MLVTRALRFRPGSPVNKKIRFKKITSKGFSTDFNSFICVLFRKIKFTKICLGKVVQIWPFPRWPPWPLLKPYFGDISGHKSGSTLILVSKHMFSGSQNLMQYFLWRLVQFLHYKLTSWWQNDAKSAITLWQFLNLLVLLAAMLAIWLCWIKLVSISIELGMSESYISYFRCVAHN